MKRGRHGCACWQLEGPVRNKRVIHGTGTGTRQRARNRVPEGSAALRLFCLAFKLHGGTQMDWRGRMQSVQTLGGRLTKIRQLMYSGLPLR